MEKILIVKVTFFWVWFCPPLAILPKMACKKCVLSLSFMFHTSLMPFLKLIVAHVSIFTFEFIFVLDNDWHCHFPNMSLLGRLLSIWYCVTSLLSFGIPLAIIFSACLLLSFLSSHGFGAMLKVLHLLWLQFFFSIKQFSLQNSMLLLKFKELLL